MKAMEVNSVRVVRLVKVVWVVWVVCVVTGVVESESLKVGKSLKIEKKTNKIGKKDMISY